MDKFEIEEKFNNILETFIEQFSTLVESVDYVKAEECGLDSRAGRFRIIGRNIIANRAARGLKYYGGFEYVNPSCVEVYGQYTIYSSDDSRVEEAIDFYNDSKNED